MYKAAVNGFSIGRIDMHQRLSSDRAVAPTDLPWIEHHTMFSMPS